MKRRGFSRQPIGLIEVAPMTLRVWRLDLRTSSPQFSPPTERMAVGENRDIGRVTRPQPRRWLRAKREADDALRFG